ncbi:hypothetical protein ACRAWC_01325 [Leifsonia sp. L25]|uniref:hypothetical protein n=1 Tax=Actinomycetes TaxID=1760 RepID=UPI003D6923A5
MTNRNDDVLSPPNGLSTKSHTELLGETIQQTNDLVQLLGGEWLDSASPPSAFDPTDRTGWRYLVPCDMNGTAEQYDIFISQVRPLENPSAAINQVRSYWDSLGYRIGQIGPNDADDEQFTEISVALEHKASLQFSASTTGMTIWISSECAAIEE